MPNIKPYPSLGELEEIEAYREDGEETFTDEDIAKLMAIKSPSDIYSVVVKERWEDDHENCLNLEVNGVKFAALWIVTEFVSDIYAAEKFDPDGLEHLQTYIEELVELYDESDMPSEILQAAIREQNEKTNRIANRDAEVLKELKDRIEDGDSIVYAVEQVVNTEMSQTLNRLLTQFDSLAQEIVERAGVEV